MDLDDFECGINVLLVRLAIGVVFNCYFIDGTFEKFLVQRTDSEKVSKDSEQFAKDCVVFHMQRHDVDDLFEDGRFLKSIEGVGIGHDMLHHVDYLCQHALLLES